MARSSAAAAYPALAAILFLLAACSSISTLTSPPPRSGEQAGIVPVISTVKLGPVCCPSEAASVRLTTMIDKAAAKASLALLNYNGADGDYVLRGDLRAIRGRGQIRVTYNWYVLSKEGKEVGRKLGMETLTAESAGTDLWDSIPDGTLQTVAEQGVLAVVARR
jgi:hypothetical protein